MLLLLERLIRFVNLWSWHLLKSCGSPDADSGKIITWGNKSYGGETSRYQKDLDDETIFEYVRISGVEGVPGGEYGGIYLYNSHPIINYVTISENWSPHCGGMMLNFSNPVLKKNL